MRKREISKDYIPYFVYMEEALNQHKGIVTLDPNPRKMVGTDHIVNTFKSPTRIIYMYIYFSLGVAHGRSDVFLPFNKLEFIVTNRNTKEFMYNKEFNEKVDQYVLGELGEGDRIVISYKNGNIEMKLKEEEKEPPASDDEDKENKTTENHLRF